MKKLLITMELFVMISILAACGIKSADAESKTEVMPEDYGSAIILAQNEFANAFSEYDGMEITETRTMVRTNDSDRLIVRFSYSSNDGKGIYGYEILRDEHGNYDIVQQGEDVTFFMPTAQENQSGCLRT